MQNTSASPVDAFDITKVEDPGQVKRARQIVRPPRATVESIPDMAFKDSLAIADELLTRFKLPQYVGCVTGEISKRPIPQAFRTAETRALTELYKKWMPFLYERIFSELTPPTQAFNRDSRLGDPEFRIPDNKKDVLLGYFASLARDGVQTTRGRVVEIYVRLQTEPANKARSLTFINDEGVVYQEDIGRQQRLINVYGVGERVGSRVRPIFNMPVENLWKQVLDTAIHNVFLKYPAFHHDMFNKRLLPIGPSDFHMCVDVKHFERHTADGVYASGLCIGGKYAEITQMFRDASYLVPSDTRKSYFLLKPRFAAGWSVQFASGDSRVAPSQKEIVSALLCEYVSVVKGLSPADCITWVFNGGDHYLTLRDYGDDMSFSGRESDVRALVRFLQEYLAAEEEQPPKFLGFIWSREHEIGRAHV